MNHTSYCARLLFLVCVLALTLAAGANAQTPRAVASDDNSKVMLGNRVILQSERDGFMSVHRIVYSPNGKHFVVIGCGYECTDNIGFLLRSDGTRQRVFTAYWDVILQDKLEWSTDSTKIYYFRINSTGADPPKSAPPEGWVVVDVATGRKGPATARRLDQRVTYSVFDTDDGLAIRARPGAKAKEVGRLPSDAKGISITGPGRLSGRALWVPIKHNTLSGWVNQNYLFKEESAQASSIDAISGKEWLLVWWKSNEAAAVSPAVTLKFENGKFVGRSACNHYSSRVATGATPGAIKVGPTISTRMACAEPVMALENRFLKQLEAVIKFELSQGKLTLIYDSYNGPETMIFVE